MIATYTNLSLQVSDIVNINSVIHIFFIRLKMSSTKDLNLGVDIEIHNGDKLQPQEHIKRSLGRDGEDTKTNQHHQGNGEKTAESPTSLSWWKKTTSLPSSLNRKKNILFQEFRNKTKLNLGERFIFFILC